MATSLEFHGIRAQGQDVRTANITAVQALANMVRTSLGPQGLDKMLVDDIGDITVTNDGATILRQLEVEHPAARILVEISQLQDQEVGDGTTSVVILAAELLKRANELIKNKIHPTHVITGYKTALKAAVRYVEETLGVDVGSLGTSGMAAIARTSLSSKLLSGESSHFSDLAVRAMGHVATPSGKHPVKNVRIIRAHGLSMQESELFPGYVLRVSRSSQQMPVRVDNPRIACLDMNLSKFRLGLGLQVLVNDPHNLELIRKRELDIMRERLEKILAAGVTAIFTTKAIDDFASKYLVEKGVIGIRRVEKSDLRKIAKATGSTIVTTLASPDGSEFFDGSAVGQAESVYEETLGDQDHIFIKIARNGTAPVCSIILRGGSEMMLEEAERSLHDSLCALKRASESGRVVAGGGSVEVALSVYLEKMAQKTASTEQIAIAEFAEALLIIPKQLALNAAKDATELVAKLIVLHNSVQNDPQNEKLVWLKHVGLDLSEGKVRNNLEHGVLEPLLSKVKSLKFATEAAISILRIDDMIKLAPEQEDMPKRHC